MAEEKKSTRAKSSDSKDETTVKQLSATGGSPEGPGSAGATGPTQDSLNPAFAPPKEDDDDKK